MLLFGQLTLAKVHTSVVKVNQTSSLTPDDFCETAMIGNEESADKQSFILSFKHHLELQVFRISQTVINRK